MSGRTRQGNSNLKRVLGTVAMSAIRDKTSYLSVFYRRIAARRGGNRALVAVMHKIAIAIWHVLRDRAPYRDLGADYFTRRNPERAGPVVLSCRLHGSPTAHRGSLTRQLRSA
jgi:hypothetical protein